MPTSYQPKRGGSIEIVSEKAVSDILLDLHKRPESSETIDREEEFINAYVQQNNKRIQVQLSRLLFEDFSSFSFRVRHRVSVLKHLRSQVMMS